MATTLERAVTTAEKLFAQDRIARRAWRRTLPDGREAVCAWIALGGGVGDFRACTALGINEPLARLIPWLDDAGSEEAWRPRMTRLLALLRRTPVLREEDWDALDYAWRRLAVEEAMRHTDDERALAVCRAVVGLCARAEAGEPVAREEWKEVRRAALEEEVTEVATWASERAAQAAAWAANVSAPTWKAVTAAVPNERDADRLATAILDALEARIMAREAA